MELWELAAREAIRETAARYAHLVDRGRIDELIELFVEDGVLEAGDRPPARGRAAIRELFRDTGKRLASASARLLIRHHVSNLAIDVTAPDDAAAESYFLAITDRGPKPVKLEKLREVLAHWAGGAAAPSAPGAAAETTGRRWGWAPSRSSAATSSRARPTPSTA